MRLQQIVREYFTFSRTEKQGLWLLGSLLLIVTVVPIFYQQFLAPEPAPITIRSVSVGERTTQSDEKPKYQFVEFNPNQVSRPKLKEMGVNEYVINNWMKYREAGGQFYHRDDVLAIYGMDKETYLTLRKYIEIPKPNYSRNEWNVTEKPVEPIDINSATAEDLMKLPGIGPVFGKRIINYRDALGGFDSVNQLKKVYGLEAEVVDGLSANLLLGPKPEQTEITNTDSLGEKRFTPEPTTVTIELNSADSLQLVSLRGIGPVYASRIMTFREALGGFVREEQLLDVYDFPPETFEQLQNQLEVESTAIRKLNINEASSSELADHPYISRPLANFIVSYRMNHNGFTDLTELKQSFLVDEAVFEKLIPYLSL